ncbi:SpoIID/LytB domain protein [Balneicella halophila]|uniref:SpoIID/LytB domain protein n=1 Tax=Balneicella halophila TaxID=1537566 RepID=A0A7L4UPN4_BALHA|nr:SpoIID/LytB domain-containing protein [Balneicella halophila]PVX50766.1 SpoIID/LytB domain protein [Balneicella halophila]
MIVKKVPRISVGIVTAPEIRFHLHGDYTFDQNNYQNAEGIVKLNNDHLQLEIGDNSYNTPEDLSFIAQSDDAYIEIFDVVIGVDFHWERKENQKFKGDLKLIKEGGFCTAINIVSLEDYLESVISSEMSATASEALLKAHAVISRSWLLAQVMKQKDLDESYQSTYETDEELIKWYDREDHKNFDVCADDHCQRYQGITRVGTKEAVKAVQATRGQVLWYDDEVCDARFSKCCGGVVESFEEVWEPEPKDYLVPLFDAEDESLDGMDLTEEKQAINFIKGAPDAFCNTKNPKILAEVLNDYDQETQNFYRWEVRYTQAELSELIKKRSGIDYGKILELIPVERSYSGRLKKLKIVGENHIKIIGKELEIRKTLSDSHLFSSALVIERDGTDFILYGAGWGHGVGLCQIGAAVMGAKGYNYTEILKHYFKNIEIKNLYY